MSEISITEDSERERERTVILIKVAELIVNVLGRNSVFPNSDCPKKRVHVNCEVDDGTLVSGDFGGGGGSLKYEVTSFISKLSRHFRIRKKVWQLS